MKTWEQEDIDVLEDIDLEIDTVLQREFIFLDLRNT